MKGLELVGRTNEITLVECQNLINRMLISKFVAKLGKYKILFI